MKKITLIGMAALMLGIGTLNTGCMGSYKLTNMVYGWNKNATGNKLVNHVIFWVLGWNVYVAFIVIDTFVLNTIEFWTGSNPMAMNAGEKEHQIVKGKDGKQYEITATQNRFDIVALNENNNKTSLIYTPINHTWNMDKNGIVTKLATIHEDINKVEIFKADGSIAMIDMNEAQMNKIWQTSLSN
jgi:Domain of unknown function (DUF3332)